MTGTRARRDRRLRARRSVEEGFTLTEVLITMLLLAIITVGVSALQIQMIRQVTVGRRAAEATRLTQQALERFQSVGYAQIISTSNTFWQVYQDTGTTVVGSRPLQNVGVDGVSAGPYTVQGMVQQLGASTTDGWLITVRTQWLDTIPTGDTTTPYRTLTVMFTAKRYP